MKATFSLLFPLVLLLLACSKDDGTAPIPDPKKGGFDIHDPAGYFIAIKFRDDVIGEGKTETLRLYQFLPGQQINRYQLNQSAKGKDYEVVDENTISVPEDRIRIVIANDEITNVTIQGGNVEGDFHLIRDPGQNELAGNTYMGSYKRNEVTLLHPNFFYGFHKNGLQVDAGLEPGAVLRTQAYESIGNFAALSELPNPGDPSKTDSELMVWIGGKLEVNYWDALHRNPYFGTFTKQ